MKISLRFLFTLLWSLAAPLGGAAAPNVVVTGGNPGGVIHPFLIGDVTKARGDQDWGLLVTTAILPLAVILFSCSCTLEPRQR